jgi:hypothetical protein
MLIQMPYQMHAFLRHLRLRRHRADEIGELSAARSLIRIKDAGEARRQVNMSVTLSCFDIGRTVVNDHQINAYAQYSIYECFSLKFLATFSKAWRQKRVDGPR